MNAWTNMVGNEFAGQAYPEYSRSIINNANQQFKSALVDLEARYGKVRQQAQVFRGL
jgi:hypothetical protein